MRSGATQLNVITVLAKDTVSLREAAVPEPGTGQVRIKTSFCGICATDIGLIAGVERLPFPLVPGHEWSGRVDAVGPGGNDSLVGKSCVGENVLDDGSEVGFEHPGGYAEMFLTDEKNLKILPEGCDLRSAAFVEPMAVCIRGLRRLSPDTHSPAVVFGDGPIGLLITFLLTRAGCTDVTLVGGRPLRLSVGKKLGAATTVNYHEAAPLHLARVVTGAGRGKYATVVEAAGTGASIRAAFEVADRNCRVLLIGDYERVNEPVPWQHLLHQEIILIPSVASHGAWDEAVRPFTSGEYDPARVITHDVDARDLSSVRKGVDLTARGEPDLIKAVMSWGS